MNPVIGLALLLLGSTTPGTPITVSATCSYTTDAVQGSTTASKCIGVVSQLSQSIQHPIFLAGGYKRTEKNADGTTTSYMNHTADGLVVRFLHKNENGDFQMLEGIQLSDGRVLVDGVPVDRDE